MAFRIDISKTALDDAESAYLWICRDSIPDAIKWYQGLLQAISSLDHLPTRCKVARETEDVGIEVRQLIYGRRMYAYRILFTISGNTVRILRVWRGARADLTPSDLEE